MAAPKDSCRPSARPPRRRFGLNALTLRDGKAVYNPEELLTAEVVIEAKHRIALSQGQSFILIR